MHSDKDEDDEEEEEEERGRPMLSILFGNLDDSGDLDEEYLDKDAKEHLSALANQLGQSLVDIELSTKRKEGGPLRDAGDDLEDYGRKADDAVDYEDIEEQYEGPEVQLQFQDEHAISQAQQFYAEAALSGPSSTLGALGSEDEDYDEDKDDEKEDYDKGEDLSKGKEYCEADEPMQDHDATQYLEGPALLLSATEISSYGGTTEQHETSLPVGAEHSPELHETFVPGEESTYADEFTPKLELPVLYKEDGKEVLRFSEIFGHHEPIWGCKREKKHQIVSQTRGMFCTFDDLVEEDEGTLLNSCSVSGREAFGQTQLLISDEDVDSVDDEDAEFSDSSSKDDTQPRNFRSKSKGYPFEAAQPMKADKANWQSILKRIDDLPSPNLHPLHQEDWEAAILWEEGHVRADPEDNATNISGVSEEIEIDAREETAFCMEEGEEYWQASLEGHSGKTTSEDMTFQFSRPVLVEPLCGLSCSQKQRDFRHPQLLRLDRLPVLKEESRIAGNEEQKMESSVGEVANIFQKFNLQSAELFSGSWLENILWDDKNREHLKKCSPKVILNLQDDGMVFEIPEEQDCIRKQASAMIISPSPFRHNALTEGGEGHNVGFPSLARFNISNDKYYMNKKTPQQQKSSLKKRTVHGIKVMHSLPALKLQSMKPKLTNKDLANFHRPKAVWYPHHNEVAAKEQGRLSVEGPMKVILKTMGGKGSKLYVDASEFLHSVKVKAAKKFGDLKTTERTKVYYCGKELEDGVSLAQQEVKPNSVLHLVRTLIHPWPKAQRLPGENKATRPPGAFKRKSDLSVKDGHVYLLEYCEERPLLLNNVGMGARLCTYYRKVSPTDSTAITLRNDRGSSVGIPLPLEPTEDSPFLGDIRSGEMQTCLETNMYRAPAFRHKVPHTDFLLVRSAKGKLSLRRIDSIHVIGQQEPHMEVLTPGSKTVQGYLNNRLLVYMYREFRNNEKPGSITRIRADELTAQFPSLSEGYLRKRLKHCADLQKGTGGEMWWIMKQNFRIPSEEELRRIVTPENVCTYESMQAGLYHLRRMGVSKLTQPSGLSAAMNQLPDEAIVLAAASHVERELQITPWNLSCNFVAATMQGRGSLERLEITGAGDPSGRGLGFSYLRVAPKPPGSGAALVEKKAAAARGGGAVTGTDADLRRLSMDAAREVLLKFNVPESQIEKLTRWHRIALVRKLSSEQAASGVKLGASALNKFARGQRMSLLQLQQQIREKCQAIWDRQVQSLCATEVDVSESEGEANEDLDSFAGDLENLLEAEEGEAEEVASSKTKKETIRGTSARRRGLLAQREEDIEDEEAEAAELRRMLMEDDEVENGKKKKKMLNIGKEKKDQDELVKDQKEDVPDSNKPDGIRKKKIIKRIIRTKKADGTYTSREIVITDPIEVERYLANKKAAQSGNASKEKKASLAVKKLKRIVSMKDSAKVEKADKDQKRLPMRIIGKKPRKLLKGDAGKDGGVQLVCGACKQVGHMRTNKKVCPLYNEDPKTIAPKQDNIEATDAPVAPTPIRPGIKIILKSAGGMQEREHHPDPGSTPVEQKATSFKIKLPFTKNVDTAPGSSSRALEDSSSGQLHEKLNKGDEITRLVKKIKIKKAFKVDSEDHRVEVDGERRLESNLSDHIESHGRERQALGISLSSWRDSALESNLPDHIESHGREKQKLGVSLSSWRDSAKHQRLYELDVDEAREDISQRDELFLHGQPEGMRLARDREERERSEKKKMKDEEQQHRIKEKVAKSRRKKERLRLEKERELDREAEERRLEMEEMQRREEADQRKEEEWMHKQWREKQQRQMEKLARQQRERENERQARAQEERERNSEKQERRQLKRLAPRDWGPLELEKSAVPKRRGPTDVSSYRAVSDAAHQPKRRKGGEVELANILEGIVDMLRKRTDISFLFLKPVTKKEAPDYLDVIQHPMDLSIIRERARKLVYKSQEDFRNDVLQIVDNAHTYNDHRNPQIPPYADRLLSLCDELLDEKCDELIEAESGIEKPRQEQLTSFTAASSRMVNRRLPRPH